MVVAAPPTLVPVHQTNKRVLATGAHRTCCLIAAACACDGLDDVEELMSCDLWDCIAFAPFERAPREHERTPKQGTAPDQTLLVFA